MRVIMLSIPDDVTDQQLYAAFGTGAEEAELHADQHPGQDGCGDKFCNKTSHEQMRRASVILTILEEEMKKEVL